jgi:exopolysaccharide production protein ExoY
VGSLLLIMLLAPVMVGAAILVRLFVGRPIILPQKRIGLGGDSFVCYKLRTMVVGGDMVLGRYPAANPAASELREVLRKSSLDELPQLFNVLRGDMSFVGPRPVVDEETRHYGPYFEECFRARPGLSGLWQVSGPKGVSYERRVALDRYYARRWSIWLDMRIILKTMTTVFSFHQTS